MSILQWARSPALLAVLLLPAWGCGGARDPVVEMQRSLASAPDYMIVLEDMREEGSFFTKYYHQYRVTQGERQAVTGWVEVPEETFRKYEAFLGMALVAKSEDGVNDKPHPAGYHYVGNPRYGSWENRGGGSFWVFYGQYAMMRDLLGGGRGMIGRNDYGDYRTTRERGRPYYGPVSADGRTRKYGTNGSVTKTQKPSFFARRKQALARRKSSFAQKVRSRTGRSRSGFGSRSRGGFGK